MIRIWAKVLVKGKIASQYVFERDNEIDYSEFFDYVREICENLDIPTPVVIKTHLFNFAKYNVLRFGADDFLEPIPFDKLVLENIFS